jgi:hypothetical protein
MLNHSKVFRFGSPYLIPRLKLPDLPKISKKTSRGTAQSTAGQSTAGRA